MMGCESVGSSTPLESHPPATFRGEVPRSSETISRGGSCYFCHQSGHWFKDCPSRTSVGSSTPAESNLPGTFRGEVIRSSEGTPGGGSCYFCHQPGHWFKDCPSRTKNRKPEPCGQGTGTDGSDFSERLCPCGAGPCLVLTSRTERNPGRKFYRCPAKPIDEKCKFFQWCDEASSVQKHGHGVAEPQPLYPSCACGAGRCRLLTMEDGENKGRKYFACPVKRGQGACNFLQWYDTLQKDCEINGGGSSKSIPLSSSVLSKESREISKLDVGEKIEDDSPLEGMLSISSHENVLPYSTYCPVLSKESREISKLDVGEKIEDDSPLEGMLSISSHENVLLSSISSPVLSKKLTETSKLDVGEKIEDDSPLEGMLSISSHEDVLPSSIMKVSQPQDGDCDAQLIGRWCYAQLMGSAVTFPAGSVKNISPVSLKEPLDSSNEPPPLLPGEPLFTSDKQVKEEKRSDQFPKKPPLSLKEQVKAEEPLDQLPIETFAMPEGNSPRSAASKSRKFFGCGIRHWMVHCVGYRDSPCRRCGKTAHQKKDCGA